MIEQTEGTFEEIVDIRGRTIRPRKGLLFYQRHANFGGLTASGIYIQGPDHLPTVFGVVVAIRHDAEICALNLPRSEGGIIPGDLIFFDRYTGEDIGDIGLLKQTDVYDHEKRRWVIDDARVEVPMYCMAEQSVLARVDGILVDPWERAVAQIHASEAELVVS